MKRIIGHFFCLAALTIFSGGAAAAAAHLASGTPPGFTELAAPRVVLVDVYFSGRKVAEALAAAEPGKLRFRSPTELLSKIPDIIDSPELGAALAGELPTNADRRCALSNREDCGLLRPDLIGIIYDEDHFRVDLFVNPRYVRTTASAPTGYLAAPKGLVSVTSIFGFNSSGTLGSSSDFNVQDRTIVSVGAARIRADISASSSLGLIADEFLAEADRRDLRYSAGLFWAPGNDFIGQRRMLGAGVGTQFDTSADQMILHSTPLIIFLAEPARIDLVVDGRLVSTRSYPGGNIELDTSALPQGSYPLAIRIHHSNGSVEDQQRFFVKDPQVPPQARPIYYGYAGFLANSRAHQLVSASQTFYFQGGTARRLNNAFALDASVFGTQHKAILEAGGWLLAGPARVRGAALVSSSGDRGALLQLTTGGHGPLTVTLDLRRLWSADGGALIPLPATIGGFDTVVPVGAQLASGSYTQAVGSVGLKLGRGFLSLLGSYRKDRGLGADYTIGSSVTYPLITHNDVQIMFEASAQRSESERAAFAGLRVQLNSRRLSLLGSLGHGSQSASAGDQPARSRLVGNIAANYSFTADHMLVSAEAGVDRNIDSSTLRASAIADGRLGSLRADLAQNLEGKRSTQYGLSFQSGMAIGTTAAVLGSSELEQSAIIVSLGGDAQGASFTVLVDDVPKGQVKPGERLSMFLPAYRQYRVRLVPAAIAAVDYDSAERKVVLYPGTVRNLGWIAQSFFTIFAQAVSPDGRPLSNALVESGRSIAETDQSGYFQIDVRRDEPITLTRAGAAPCRVGFNGVAEGDFKSLGKVVCQ